MDGANGKPVGGRIHFGSLEVVEAKKRQAAAAAAASAAATVAATATTSSTASPVPSESSQPKGQTLDQLSKTMTKDNNNGNSTIYIIPCLTERV